MPIRKNFDLLQDHRNAMDQVEKEMTRLGLEIERDAADFLDDHKVNVDGTLKKSLTHEVERFTDFAIKLIAGAGAKHAYWVHEGTYPRQTFPPIEPIRRWVKKKLAIAEPEEIKRVAFLIARSIKERGTSMSRSTGQNKGPIRTPFMDHALQQHAGTFAKRMQDAYLKGFN